MPAAHVPAPRLAGVDDVAELAASLSVAFDGYPLTEWVVLRDERHEDRRRNYFEMFLNHGVEHGEVHCDEPRRAAAIWFPPDGWKAGFTTLLARLRALARTTGWRNLSSRLAGLTRLAGHHPAEPHWYLEVIGVHPDAQREGTGTTLLEAGLARARADGVGAYLITSSEKAIPFYTRHGFAIRDTIQVAGAPACWSLWRAR